jgi:DNA-binding NtrC family response regulator
MLTGDITPLLPKYRLESLDRTGNTRPMPTQTLLLLADQTLSMESEWSEMLSTISVRIAGTLPAGMDVMAADEIDCVLVKGHLGTVESMDILELVHQFDATMPVIFWNPEMGAAEAVRLVRAGAWHCLGHRDSLETLHECIENAMEETRGRAMAARRASTLEPWRSLLVGESRAMESVVETIRLIGPRRCTVLIGGETGTGKEMAARALHMASPRANQPMVAINCSALPENLLEAELFGHVKGAFTGAVNARVGRFEQAHKGTLFLDEIGDMPLELQAKLLRVLQDRELQRLGSSETIRVDVRVIAATNVNLLERVRQGKFREDLYYRLNVVPLQMPPLRKRGGDVPLLVEHFVRKICQIEDIAVKNVTPAAVDRLANCAWPGNVRQLENAVEMAVAMSGDRQMLFPADFGLAPSVSLKVVPFEAASVAASFPISDRIDFETAVSNFERGLLEGALEKTSGNKTAAAELLGLKRTTLIMKLRSLVAQPPVAANY